MPDLVVVCQPPCANAGPPHSGGVPIPTTHDRIGFVSRSNLIAPIVPPSCRPYAPSPKQVLVQNPGRWCASQERAQRQRLFTRRYALIIPGTVPTRHLSQPSLVRKQGDPSTDRFTDFTRQICASHASSFHVLIFHAGTLPARCPISCNKFGVLRLASRSVRERRTA